MLSPESRSNSDAEPQPVTENKKEQASPSGSSKADVYRKKAFEYKRAGKKSEALAESFRDYALDVRGLPESLLLHLSKSRREALKKAREQFKRSIIYLKSALDEDKKNKNTIDEIKDHFELAEIYMIKKSFGKAIQHVLEGLELNLTKESKQTSGRDKEDNEGLRILAIGLNHVSKNKWAIPYYEQAIAMFGKLEKKYPLANFKASVEDVQFNLEFLQELPQDESGKYYRVLSDRNGGAKENTPVPNEHGFKRRPIFSPLVENCVFSPLSAEVVLEPVEQISSRPDKKKRAK